MPRTTLFVLISALGACDPNQSGNISSTQTGDTSHPLAAGSPINDVRAACGDGSMTLSGSSAVHRQPYLQQVTTASAMIGWVTTAPPGEHVVLTAPGGDTLATADAVVENGARRQASETQMWATLDGLTPDTINCYTVVNGDMLVSRTGFRTAPAADSTKTIRFLAFGDSGGGGEDQFALRDQMFGFPYDFMIHTGDLAYDSGTIDQFEDNVFSVYAELFKNLAFFPAAGNHDAGTLGGAPFRDVFALPGTSGEHWYSYDYGRIHFAALDTEADYQTQATWLEADLAASTAPWKILYMHRPPFSSGNHGSDLPLRKLIAPIAERHGVQLVLAGHDHDYERMIPQNGVAYVVTGGGGRGTYSVGHSDFSAFSESVIHFVIVEVGIDELTLHAIDATGVEFDSMVVPRTGA